MIPDLRSEPPAIANLVAHDFRVTGEALPATLIDLAARDVVDIVEIAPDRYQCIVGDLDPAGLRPFERSVLAHLRDRARDGVVPAGALTTGWDEESRAWSAEFTAAVVHDAYELGLVRGGRVAIWPLALVPLTAVLVLLAWWLIESHHPSPPLLGLAAIVGLAAIYAITALLESPRYLDPPLRPTTAGREAAAGWSAAAAALREDEQFATLPSPAVALWDRYLAYAVAFGLAPAAARGLPMGVDSTRSLWSAVGGRWRRVRLRYPLLWPPAWGRRPGVAAAGGLSALAAAGGVLALAARRGRWHPAPPFSEGPADAIGRAEPLIVAMAIAALIWATVVLARAAPDLVREQVTVTGVVVRRWVRQGHRLNPWGMLRPVRHYLAVDDGTAAVVRGLAVPERAFSCLREGDTVVAVVTPTLRHVREIAPVR